MILRAHVIKQQLQLPMQLKLGGGQVQFYNQVNALCTKKGFKIVSSVHWQSRRA